MVPPAVEARRSGPLAWTWAASLALHVLVLAGGASWMLRASQSPVHEPVASPAPAVIPIELPSMAEGSLFADDKVKPDPEPLEKMAGGTAVPRLDTGRSGHGGDGRVDHAAKHLSDVDERMPLSYGTLDRLDREQVQRVRSNTERATEEDRRSTTHPMDLAFLASGTLERLERRAISESDPSRGARVHAFAIASGGVVGDDPGDDGPGVPGSESEGRKARVIGAGVLDGSVGLDHRLAARTARARPDLPRARVSVEAARKGRPRDDVDSQEEVAARLEALVHASTSGAALLGEGRGGEHGPGDPGALGASGAGSHPSPLGDDWFDLSTTDPRLVAYFRRFHQKVDPLWADAFPKSAILDLKQGTVILEVTIEADGRAQVAWPPLRKSGIDEFDRRCADAVRRAGPFDPIPPGLGSILHVRAPFVASNPVVN